MGGVYSQLAGMIEMTHVVLRLLDTLTKEEGALRVSLFSPVLLFHYLLLHNFLTLQFEAESKCNFYHAFTCVTGEEKSSQCKEQGEKE
jgi:hypothetical protein